MNKFFCILILSFALVGCTSQSNEKKTVEEVIIEEPSVVDAEEVYLIPSKTIKVERHSRIILDDKTVKLAELSPEMTTFIRENKSNHTIYLFSYDNTDRGFYTKVKNILTSSYATVRDEKALEVYKKPYKKLTKEEQKVINAIYPDMVSERQLID